MILWIVGMSGAGKTSLGTVLARKLRERAKNLVYLDGDILREVWCDALGHDIEGRRMNARRISHLCRMLDRQGQNVVAAVLSIFPEWQQWNRENLTDYREVYLKVPTEQLFERDSKGLYARALAGELSNVVGVDIPFPEPASDMVIDNVKPVDSFDGMADDVIEELGLVEVLK